MSEVTRHYVDVGSRLVHYRRAGHGPPVILLHASPRSSAAMLPLMESAPGGVSVFALDTPGYGQSDPLPSGRATLCDFADATMAAVRALGIARAPLYGTHTGASIAFMAALRHPDACALTVLDGFPVFTAPEREEALASYLPPFRPAIDGTHLAWLWSRVRDQTMFFPWYRRGGSARLPGPPATPAALHAIALDILRAGDHYRTAYAEAFASRPLDGMIDRASRIVFGARLDDVLSPHLDRLPAGCEVARFPADHAGWAEAVWRLLADACHGHAPAPVPAAAGIRYASLPGGQLHVRGSLRGEGRPLLLLHSLPGSALAWQGMIDREAGSRPVLAPDLPGAGDSDAIVGDLADVLEAWSAELGEVELRGAHLGNVLALALHRRDPKRFALGRVSNTLPLPDDATPPEPGAFAPHPAGAHLLMAWQHERDAAALGPWEMRTPGAFDTIDVEKVHERTVELLKARADPAPSIAALLALPYREWLAELREKRLP